MICLVGAVNLMDCMSFWSGSGLQTMLACQPFVFRLMATSRVCKAPIAETTGRNAGHRRGSRATRKGALHARVLVRRKVKPTIGAGTMTKPPLAGTTVPLQDRSS